MASLDISAQPPAAPDQAQRFLDGPGLEQRPDGFEDVLQRDQPGFQKPDVAVGRAALPLPVEPRG